MLQAMLDGEIQPCSIGACLTARYDPLDDHLLHRLSTISSGPTSLFGIQHLRLDPVFPPVRHSLHQSEKACRCITRNQIGIKPVIQHYLLFWHTQFLVDNLSNQVNELQASGAKFVSKSGNVQQIVCDPDGHSLQINASANSGVTLR